MHHSHWDDVLFVHYPVDTAALQQRLPPELVADEHGGVSYVGIVALTEAGIVPWPKGAPLWLMQCIGLSHFAVNVRTYVRPRSGGPAGIFFFSLDCSSLLPTLGARLLFNLPYRFATMERHVLRDDLEGSRSGQPGALMRALTSRTHLTSASFSAEWVGLEEVQDTDDDPLGSLGPFFVERYTLYNEAGWSAAGVLRCLSWLMGFGSTSIWSGTITHAPWPLHRVRLLSWSSSVLEAVGLSHIVNGEPVAHCSQGVKSITFFWQGFVSHSQGAQPPVAALSGCERVSESPQAFPDPI
jgi:uncharacterized protein YqjF (DUF2071 family)